KRTDALLEGRLAGITTVAPQFSAALRGYRIASVSSDRATADGVLAWAAGQPHVAAGVKKTAGIKGDLDHFGALGFLQGVLTLLRDGGHAGLLVVLDEVETIQRVRSDARDKSLNALRQLIDEVEGGRFPGLFLLITGTPAFYDGPQGVRRLEPLAQRLHVDFQTDARFDNPRAVQVRLPPFDLDRLCKVGSRVRDIFLLGASSPDRVAKVCDDALVRRLAEAVAGKLGGKVGIAPRIFLKKLVADVLDRVDLHPDFDPARDYSLTVSETEMTPVERQASGAKGLDEIELDIG
ncbi:MAG: BREX system ATP-binding protein BrxD, partial [Planctomycetes bacterium]|nr:BREX system ATP-binding protein BrxD [Planctomycetota bacterium]